MQKLIFQNLQAKMLLKIQIPADPCPESQFTKLGNGKENSLSPFHCLSRISHSFGFMVLQWTCSCLQSSSCTVGPQATRCAWMFAGPCMCGSPPALKPHCRLFARSLGLLGAFAKGGISQKLCSNTRFCSEQLQIFEMLVIHATHSGSFMRSRSWLVQN